MLILSPMTSVSKWPDITSFGKSCHTLLFPLIAVSLLFQAFCLVSTLDMSTSTQIHRLITIIYYSLVLIK